MGSKIDLGKILEEAEKVIGHANIIISGKTGIGKSTLLNSVFQSDFAKTGVGKPITAETKCYSKIGFPISIYDTQGLELKNYTDIITRLEIKINDLQKDPEPSNHIHCAWICVLESSKRIEEGERALAEMFLRLKIPFIVVVTQCISDRKNRDFVQEIKKAFPEASQIVETLATDFVTAAGSIEAFGLSELVQVTLEIIPEGQRNAFITAQKISIDLKKNAAKKVVMVAATAAAAVGYLPLPGSDWVALSGIQLGMLAKISLLYGFNLTETFLMTILKGALGAGLASFTGIAVVSSLLKFIPGVGTMVGGTISAATAATMTTILGLTYIKTVSMMANKNVDPSSLKPEDIAEAFKNNMKNPTKDEKDV